MNQHEVDNYKAAHERVIHTLFQHLSLYQDTFSTTDLIFISLMTYSDKHPFMIIGNPLFDEVSV